LYERRYTVKNERKVILVVDDHQGILDTIEMLFSDEFEVILAIDAFQALSVLRDVEPDMIFLDYMMPGFNGIQLLREIKQMHLGSKIVVVTASVLDEILDEVQWLGVDGLVRKPFDIAQIMNFTEDLIQQAS